MLRRIVLLFLLVFILAVGALAALPLFVNVEGAREQIIAQVEQQTGMALRLDGDISVSAFPQIAVSAKAVGLAPSSGQDEILEAGEVRFGLKLLPLISGRFELSSLTLVEPEYTIAAGDGANVEPAGDSDSLPVTSTELGRLQDARAAVKVAKKITQIAKPKSTRRRCMSIVPVKRNSMKQGIQVENGNASAH